MGLLGELHEALSRAGDARVRDWPLLGSPLPLLALLAGYLWVVKVAAPRLMRGRAPCRLRAPVAAYNLLQVLANACLFHGLLTNGWTKNFNLGCYMPDYSDNPEALKMATLVWYELCLKVVDLIETVLFVLRGKEKQASFLHVYHHVATVLIVYTGAKFVPGAVRAGGGPLCECDGAARLPGAQVHTLHVPALHRPHVLPLLRLLPECLPSGQGQALTEAPG
ncbi:very long chain fatty acid elongase AAEL008004-like isoform X2 [Bacillus rossius redtenbacheri]|uniref:very long chain fatty acid elongase AAEL008004-like isoform X2 n=1 Tax=Bacillus rossius redtenbacheri TaxID=93214 RepID=UPI002FDE773A